MERKPSGVFNPIRAFHDIVLGKKLAPGIVVTFSSGTASIHILNTTIKETLKEVKSFATAFADSIQRYQLVSGLAPSKRGFEVMALALRKLLPKDGEARRELKQLCSEALAFNLLLSEQPKWQREISISIGGVDTRISVSLVPLSPLRRLGLRLLNTDVPVDERLHRFGYKLEMRPEQSSGNAVLNAIASRIRQAVVVGTLISPMVLTAYAMMTASTEALTPQISANPQVQRLVVGVACFSVLAGMGAILHRAHDCLINRKITGRFLPEYHSSPQAKERPPASRLR
jgi:hypothetical protein